MEHPLKNEPSVRELRLATHMTQVEFANYLNINVKTLRSWEQNARTPMNGLTSLIYRLLVAEKQIPPDFAEKD